jgi:glycosyltransferase involved in cell wall biosynthesis
VACSGTTSLPEVGGDAVRYFDPVDEGSIAAALAELWQDAGRRQDLAQRGLVRSQSFAWDGIVPQVLQAYEAALAV